MYFLHYKPFSVLHQCRSGLHVFDVMLQCFWHVLPKTIKVTQRKMYFAIICHLLYVGNLAAENLCLLKSVLISWPW